VYFKNRAPAEADALREVIERFLKTDPNAGTIIAASLTVGLAFVADSAVTGEATYTNRQIVNWEVAQQRLHGFTTLVRTEWERLESQIHRLT